ncbi:MAG TPA: twin-arginine translocation signal domain-containing protein [Stellaceae bacterium]|nr:twin-arginine translocation signal domain-containing protein [Stellaceae bacterium]
MSGEQDRRSTRLSRRSLLQGAAAAGILGAAPTPATAQPKISKVAVNYQDHPDGDKRCEKCVQFQPPDGCKVVEGTISPQGSCRIFMLSRA